MRVERTRTLRPPASPDAGVRPSTQPHHHGCRGGAMNQTTQALEHASVRQYCKVLRMPVIGSNFVWLSEQAIKERAERAALIVTTNLTFSEWTQVFSNPRLCKALLDRITDRAHIIETGTESYRFRRTLEVRQKKKAS